METIETMAASIIATAIEPVKQRKPSNAARLRFAEQIEELAGLATAVDRLWVRAKFGHQFLASAQLVDWVVITKDPAGKFWFTIDRELRDICEGRRERPELGGFTLRDWFKNLRGEISRRRREYKEARNKRMWVSRTANLLDHVELLDWIESEFEKIP